MRIHIVGSGAIGSHLAFNLKRHTPHQLVLHYRRRPPTGAECIGLVPFGQLPDNVLVEGGFEVESREDGASAATRPIDVAIFTTKAQQLEAAVENVKYRLTPQSAILLLPNGLFSVLPTILNSFRDLSRRPAILLGHTAHGVRPSPSPLGSHPVWVHAGMATMSCAVLPSKPATFNENAIALQSALSQCPDLHVEHVGLPSLLSSAHTKLAINCAVNAATALVDDRNGSLLSPYARPFLESMTEEVAGVLAARTTRESIARMVDCPAFLESEPALTARQLLEATLGVLQATRENEASTLTDVRRLTSGPVPPAGESDGSSSPWTELDHINGHLSRLGRECGIATPLNDALYALVNAKCEALARRRAQAAAVV